jgi:hypothetical protein
MPLIIFVILVIIIDNVNRAFIPWLVSTILFSLDLRPYPAITLFERAVTVFILAIAMWIGWQLGRSSLARGQYRAAVDRAYSQYEKDRGLF